MTAALGRLLGRAREAGDGRSPSPTPPPPAVDVVRELFALRLKVAALLAVAPIAKGEDPPLKRLREAGAAGIDPATLRPDLLLAVAALVDAGAVEAAGGGRVRLSPSKVAAIDRDVSAEAQRDAANIRAQLRARRDGDLAAVVADPRHHPALAAAAASQGATLAEMLVDFMAIAGPKGEDVLRCRWCGAAAPLGDARTFKLVHASGCVAAGPAA